MAWFRMYNIFAGLNINRKKQTMIIENVNIHPLLKAFKKFENFRKNLGTEQEKAGAIQAFEYCFELCWRIMKKLLEARGRIANSPKETFRMAALEGFISDPEKWFDFLKKRNLTVHTYEEKEANEVLSVFENFSMEIQFFLKEIGIGPVYI
jgi:nucleotidyltransferase substrate binding protein (TIGR01987 family)